MIDGDNKIVALGPGDDNGIREDGNIGRTGASATGVNGHLEDVVENTSSGSGNDGQHGGLVLMGVINNSGVGDGPGRYISGPNDGVRPRSQICGREPTHGGIWQATDTNGITSGGRNNNGEGLKRYTVSPNTGVVDTTPTCASESNSSSDGGPATSSVEPSRERVELEVHNTEDKMAIAGDPSSTLQRRNRPQRTIRRPARFAD